MYSLTQSPLFKIQSKKRLRAILHLSKDELEFLTKDTGKNYVTYPITQGTKQRIIQIPKHGLKKIHKQLFVFLQRIEAPDYLHSGTKGRSYVTNANAHRTQRELLKLDIKQFYPSVSPSHIYYFFNNKMQCSKDVSWLLQELCICDKILPTGSCISQIIAFYAYKDMFDELEHLSSESSLTMTCYVDDLTFSGENISKEFSYRAKQIVKKAGLIAHKEHFYGESAAKLVTGVIIKDNELRVQNCKQQQIHNDMTVVKTMKKGPEKDHLLEELMGRCSAACSIDKNFRKMIEKLKKLNKA